MGKGLFLGFVAMSLLLFSCKKEESFEVGQGNNNTGSLLRKQVISLGGNDSVVATFGYDADQRLVSVNTTGTVESISTTGSHTIERNTEGIIQTITTSDEDVTGGSTTFTVNYDAASSRYTSKTGTYDVGGTTIKDSTAFTYDASGNIALQEQFLDDGTTGGYLQYLKKTFAYNNDNIASASVYLYNPSAGDYEEIAEQNFEYDDKIAPLNLSVEAFLLDDASFANANNITKITLTSLVDPDLDDVTTFTYVYDAEGRPVSSSFLVQSTGIPLPITYTYQ